MGILQQLGFKPLLTGESCARINIAMTPELQSALKRHMQWFGSYRKSGELVKVQVWLIVNSGRIEFLTGKDSYKVRRLRRNPRAICYVGKKNGPSVLGTAEIVSDKADLARVYRVYWKTHPVFMLLGIGLRIWIEMLLGNRVVVRVDPSTAQESAYDLDRSILRNGNKPS
jgi:PPOX class probable F420-dependent enzyme